ncbi:ionotropic receptor 21a-like isoform X2 [Palaemon carinicauda]|uniref:ionotropic receptor 21a-like isoform X2 n=1 Tax=Palaemon carinicauda TaxID=392227 RepID=UPI0035B6820D
MTKPDSLASLGLMLLSLTLIRMMGNEATAGIANTSLVSEEDASRKGVCAPFSRRETPYVLHEMKPQAVVGYVVENFLDNCGLYLIFDPRNTNSQPVNIIQSLGLPLMVVALDWSPEEGLFLSNATRLIPFRTCSAYIIIAEDPDGIRSLILSAPFKEVFHYLGRYVFVMGSTAGSPGVILDNEVMAWRPHALVIKAVEKVVTDVSRVNYYELWSHSLFRQDISEKVYLVERWDLGGAQRKANLFPDKLNDFHRNELTAVTFEHPPSIVEVPHKGDSRSGGHHYDGIDIRLLRLVSEALNFRLKITNPSDGGKWGSPNEDGSWSGLTGDLTQRKAHMGVANIFIHTNYLQVVDMTRAYDMEAGCFITPLPEDLPQWVALVYPFSREVWILTLLFLFLGTPMLYAVSRMASYCLRDEFPWGTNLYQITFYGMGIFFGQGVPQEPRGDVTRSYFIMWVWYSVLITVVYRSSLTAFLTIPLEQPPINTLEQLASSKLPAWGSTGITFKKLLQASPDPMVRSLADRYYPVSGTKEGIDLTAQRKYAMMENRQFLEYTIATNFTNQYGEETLHVMEECFLPFQIGMALPKKAPYKPNFDNVITKIVEAGLVRKWLRDIIATSQRRGGGIETEDRDGSALTLNNLQGAWLLLGSGILISLVMFIMENIVRPSKQ